MAELGTDTASELAGEIAAEQAAEEAAKTAAATADGTAGAAQTEEQNQVEAEAKKKEREERQKRKTEDKIKLSKIEAAKEREARQKIEIENAELRGKLAGMKEATGKETVDPNAPPAPPDHSDDETLAESTEKDRQYNAELISWNAKQIQRSFDEKLEKLKPTTATAAAENPRQKAIDDTLSRGRAEFDDFDEVTAEDSLTLTPAMRDAILDGLDDPGMAHHVTYFLGDNPKVQEKILALPPAKQFKEILALEKTLKETLKPKATSAPPVIQVVPGSSGAGEEIPDDIEGLEAALKKSKGK